MAKTPQKWSISPTNHH